MRGVPRACYGRGGCNAYLWPGSAAKATSVAHLPEATPSVSFSSLASPRLQDTPPSPLDLDLGLGLTTRVRVVVGFAPAGGNQGRAARQMSKAPPSYKNIPPGPGGTASPNLAIGQAGNPPNKFSARRTAGLAVRVRVGTGARTTKRVGGRGGRVDERAGQRVGEREGERIDEREGDSCGYRSTC